MRKCPLNWQHNFLQSLALLIAKLLMQYYTFAELHANTVRENKLVGLSGHLQIEKALIYIYIH